MALKPKLPALAPLTVEPASGAPHPPPFTEAAGRIKRALGDAVGLSQFGVNLVELPPGCWSSQRHWHTREDEFVYVLAGEITLVTDAGEQRLEAGMAAGFPAGKADGHHLINRTDRAATYLEVGSRRPDVDEVIYADIDLTLRIRDGVARFETKGGEPY